MAPAAPVFSQPMSAIGFMSDAERAVLAEKWGFNQIGKELPDNVRLSDIVKSMPRDVFEINPVRAWAACAVSIVSMAASLYLIHVSPAWFLPFAWAISGTAFTGWFVIGHDCGHKSFSKNKFVEDLVGLFFFAPLLYPFEPWRIKHNVHHAYTNKLVDDTAWHPVMKSEVEDMENGGAVGMLSTPLPTEFSFSCLSRPGEYQNSNKVIICLPVTLPVVDCSLKP